MTSFRCIRATPDHRIIFYTAMQQLNIALRYKRPEYRPVTVGTPLSRGNFNTRAEDIPIGNALAITLAPDKTIHQSADLLVSGVEHDLLWTVGAGMRADLVLYSLDPPGGCREF